MQESSKGCCTCCGGFVGALGLLFVVLSAGTGVFDAHDANPLEDFVKTTCEITQLDASEQDSERSTSCPVFADCQASWSNCGVGGCNCGVQGCDPEFTCDREECTHSGGNNGGESCSCYEFTCLDIFHFRFKVLDSALGTSSNTSLHSTPAVYERETRGLCEHKKPKTYDEPVTHAHKVGDVMPCWEAAEPNSMVHCSYTGNDGKTNSWPTCNDDDLDTVYVCGNEVCVKLTDPMLDKILAQEEAALIKTIFLAVGAVFVAGGVGMLILVFSSKSSEVGNRAVAMT